MIKNKKNKKIFKFINRIRMSSNIKLYNLIKDYLPNFNNNLQQDTYVLDYDAFDISKYQFCIKNFENNKLKSKKYYNILMPINKTIDFAFNSLNNSYSLQIRNKNKIPYDYIAYNWRNKVYTNFQDYCFYIKVEDLDSSKENILLTLLTKKDDNNNYIIPTIMMNNKRMLQVEISMLDGKVYPILTNYTDNTTLKKFKNLYDMINYYQILYFDRINIFFLKHTVNMDLNTFINNFKNNLNDFEFYEDLQTPYFYNSSYIVLNNYYTYKFLISTPIGKKIDVKSKSLNMWRNLLDYVPLYQRDLFQIDSTNNFILKNNSDNTKIYCIDIINCVVLQINASEKTIYQNDKFLIFNTDQLMNENDFLISVKNDKFLSFPVKNNNNFEKSKVDERKLKYKNNIFQPLIENYLNLNNQTITTLNKSNIVENTDVQIFKVTNFNNEIKLYIEQLKNIINNNNNEINYYSIQSLNNFVFNDNTIYNNEYLKKKYNMFYNFINNVKNILNNLLQKDTTLILLNYDKKDYLLNNLLQIFNYMLFLKIYNNVELLKTILLNFLNEEYENYLSIENNINVLLKNNTNDIIIKLYNKIIEEIALFNNEIINKLYQYINDYNFLE